MANTISVSLTATAVINSQTVAAAKSFTATLAGTNSCAARQTLPTVGSGTAEAIVKGEVGTINYLVVINESATETVTLYNQSTISGAVTLGVLAPGQAVFMIPAAANIYAASTTASDIYSIAIVA